VRVVREAGTKMPAAEEKGPREGDDSKRNKVQGILPRGAEERD